MADRSYMNKKQKTKKWYFLSFRDPNKNKNLGCCNVGVRGGLEEALKKTRQLKINPGGEVLAYQIKKPELIPNILYSRKEILSLFYKLF